MIGSSRLLTLAILVSTLFGSGRLSPLAAADGEAFLANMAGDWRGRGIARESASSSDIAILCAISSNFSSDRSELVTKGECASTNGKVQVQGLLNYGKVSKTISGSLFNAQESDFRTQVRDGTVNGNSLSLRLLLRDKGGILKGQGSTTFKRISPRSMRLNMVIKELATGKTYNAMNLTMSKR